jgi:diguanylate cyclase
VYSIGVLAMVGLLSGQLPIGFWTTHAFQFASMLEMAMWMLALNVRVDEIRRSALRLEGERDELRSLLQTDHLTGLLNRRGLLEVAPALLDLRQPGQSVAVFLVDLDGFKTINDRLGHEAGDALLSSVADRLREAMRDQDLICRLGGDEFVLVAAGLVSEIDAARMGDKLVRALEQPFDIKGSVCRVGLTVGYALAPQDDNTLPGLLKRADAAMYGGKQSGRNCVRRGAAGAGLSGI